MKILVAGAYGQLGTSIVRRISSQHQVFAYSSQQLDIRSEEQVLQIVREIKPTIIINCAAYNNVNQAELYTNEAKLVNEVGAYNLAKAAEFIQATLIHISTDYVFDGNKKSPYVEEDIPNPLNIYGMTKYRGEQLIQDICSRYIIIRTSWLYSEKNNNFVHTILRLVKEKERLNIISDHLGTPTYTEELAEAIERLIHEGANGLYHCSGNGFCSWYDFAREIVRLAKIECDIQPISALDYQELAKKPSYSVLDKSKFEKTTGYQMKEWQETLKLYFRKNN